MTKETLIKGNELNSKINKVETLLNDLVENNSPLIIQSGLVHALQFEADSYSGEEENIYNLFVELLKDYCNKLKIKFEGLE